MDLNELGLTDTRIALFRPESVNDEMLDYLVDRISEIYADGETYIELGSDIYAPNSKDVVSRLLRASIGPVTGERRVNAVRNLLEMLTIDYTLSPFGEQVIVGMLCEIEQVLATAKIATVGGPIPLVGDLTKAELNRLFTIKLEGLK